MTRPKLTRAELQLLRGARAAVLTLFIIYSSGTEIYAAALAWFKMYFWSRNIFLDHIFKPVEHSRTRPP